MEKKKNIVIVAACSIAGESCLPGDKATVGENDFKYLTGSKLAVDASDKDAVAEVMANVKQDAKNKESTKAADKFAATSHEKAILMMAESAGRIADALEAGAGLGGGGGGSSESLEEWLESSSEAMQEMSSGMQAQTKAIEKMVAVLEKALSASK